MNDREKLDAVLKALRSRVNGRKLQSASVTELVRPVVLIKYYEALAALHDVENALGLPRSDA